MEKKNQGISRVASAYRKAAPILDGAYQMMAIVGLGAVLGWWLDKKWGTAPWLLLAASLLGIGLGMAVFFRAVIRAGRQ